MSTLHISFLPSPLSLCVALSCTSPCPDPHLGLGVSVAGEVEGRHEEFPRYPVLAVLRGSLLMCGSSIGLKQEARQLSVFMILSVSL